MKKVYLVERLDDVDYDEYISCIILANSVEEVNEIIGKYPNKQNIKGGYYLGYWDNGLSDRKITEINLNEVSSGILLTSFMGG